MEACFCHWIKIKTFNATDFLPSELWDINSSYKFTVVSYKVRIARYIQVYISVSKLILSYHHTTCPLDPIPSHLLQAISPAVVSALTHIPSHWCFSLSISTGSYNLTKKPTLNQSLLENYRPVSLLHFIAKTLEWAVFNQVSAFLTPNNLLDSNQSGFRLRGISHLQESPKNTSLPSLFDPLTLAFSILILFLKTY